MRYQQFLVTVRVFSMLILSTFSTAFNAPPYRVYASPFQRVRTGPFSVGSAKQTTSLSRRSKGTSRRQRSATHLKVLVDNVLIEPLTTRSTFLVRILFLRAMAFVSAVAFTVAWRQNKALVGDRGIAPAKILLDKAQERGKMKRQRRLDCREQTSSTTRATITDVTVASRLRRIFQWKKLPRRIGEAIDENPLLVNCRERLWDRSDSMDHPAISLLWLAKDRTSLNPWLDGIAIAGILLSIVVFGLGAANVPIVLALWICQRSLMTVGGPFYAFGWEPLLAEVLFHTLFLVPFWSLNPIAKVPVPVLVQWTVRWMLFRIMLGAGLIKLRSGDAKWKDLTAMNYFYETQPVPNPLSRHFHRMPGWWHKQEVLVNHFVELIAPWLLILPGLPVQLRRLGGTIQLIFQSILICSGNFSFLNWLTMIPAIMCLDDALVGRMFSPAMQQAAVFAAATSRPSILRQIVSVTVFGVILQLSRPVVRNLMSTKQIMNSCYGPLQLINTYGAFGTVEEERLEFVISAATSFDDDWIEYDFKVKRGNVNEKPRWISPYHYRIDWQMWVASTLHTIERSPWLYSFMIRLLQQDPDVLNLLRRNPFTDVQYQPKYIRIDMYKYKFHDGKPMEKSPPYWDRVFVRQVYPRQGAASLDSLQAEIGIA
jgi:hypothetical protein